MTASASDDTASTRQAFDFTRLPRYIQSATHNPMATTGRVPLTRGARPFSYGAR